MSREQFTPGPWENYRWLIRHQTGGVDEDGVPWTEVVATASNDANARLIAQAPALLAACEAQAAIIRKLLPLISFEQLHDIGMTPTLISVSDQVCSALDKARGESEARDGGGE